MENLKELFAQFVSEDVLTEDNLTKIEVMFESAINEAIKVKTESLDIVYEEKLREEVEDFKTVVNEGLEDYLSLFVEEFTAENKIGITHRLQVEKAQTILSKMQEIFAENGIQIPDSNDTLLEDMNTKFEDMEAKYNAVQSEKIELSKGIIEMEKASIFTTMTENIFDTEKEQLMNLMEGLRVDGAEDFKAKLSIFIEKVCKKEEEDEDSADEDDKDKKKKKVNKDEDEVKKDDEDEDVKKESNDSWSDAYSKMKLN